MAYILYVGQVQRSVLTRWIDMKATKLFHCNDLPVSIFRNVLFHDATAAASTRGYVLTRLPLRPVFFGLLPLMKKEGISCIKKHGSLMNGLTFLPHRHFWKHGMARESVRMLTATFAEVRNPIDKKFCQSGHAMLSFKLQHIDTRLGGRGSRDARG